MILWWWVGVRLSYLAGGWATTCTTILVGQQAAGASPSS